MERELNRMQFEELRTALRTRHENPAPPPPPPPPPIRTEDIPPPRRHPMHGRRTFAARCGWRPVNHSSVLYRTVRTNPTVWTHCTVATKCTAGVDRAVSTYRTAWSNRTVWTEHALSTYCTVGTSCTFTSYRNVITKPTLRTNRTESTYSTVSTIRTKRAFNVINKCNTEGNGSTMALNGRVSKLLFRLIMYIRLHDENLGLYLYMYRGPGLYSVKACFHLVQYKSNVFIEGRLLA